MGKINKGHYFELMDRCHVQMESIEIFLLSNPHIEANWENREKLILATELIGQVYQWASAMDNEESKQEEG